MSTPNSWENSEVLPLGSVAVAVTNWAPPAGVGNWKTKLALPVPSVVTRRRAEDVPALAVARRVHRRERVEIERERRVGRAVQGAGHGRHAARARDRGDHREVLIVVGAGVPGRVVQGDAVAAQVDPQPGVGEDRVEPDLVAGPGRGVDIHADAGGEGDGVAGAGGRAADRVIGRAAVDLDAVAVAQRVRAGDVGADQVALDQCAGRVRVEPDAARWCWPR